MTEMIHVTSSPFQPLLPFYVYVLMDPRDQSVFYVGKGQGSRVQSHVREHASRLNDDTAAENAKLRMISDIKASGHSPLELVIGRYESEDEAFAVEATLIRWVYGFSNLSNAVHGHGSTHIRSRGQHGKIEGLDVPMPVRGGYRNEKVEGLSGAGAFDLQDALRTRLEQEGFNVRDYSAPADRPFDPGASNGWLGLIVRLGYVDFNIGFSKTCKPGVGIANTLFSRSPEAQAQLERIATAKGDRFVALAPKNSRVQGQGRYRDFAKKPQFNAGQLEELIELLRDLQAQA